VRTEYINRISEINVNFNIIITDQKGDWAVLTNIAPELTLSEIDIPNELIFHKAKFFHVDGFLCRTLKEIDAIFSAIDLAHSQGSLVSVDCAVPVARENPDFLRKLFKKCDIFLANEEEARAVTGEVTTAEIICVLQKVGPSLSVLKVGQNGSYYITSQGVGHIPAYDVDIVDTVAAGDALLGTLLWCLSHGFTLYEAAIRGSAAASLACLGMGSLSSHFGLKEIENLIAHGSKKKEINKHE